jgi:phosphatidylglycerophosphate synthase
MLDSALRHAKEAMLIPTARILGAHVNPTHITLLAAGVGLAAATAAATGTLTLALTLWLLNRILDGLDGTLARLYNKQTDLGGYLDLLLDFLVYAAIPFGLVLAQPRIETLLALAFMLGSFYINAASYMVLAAILEKRNLGAQTRGEYTTITMPGGLIEGTETVIFYTLFFMFPQHLTVLFIIMAVLVGFTIGQRVYWATHHLR